MKLVGGKTLLLIFGFIYFSFVFIVVLGLFGLFVDYSYMVRCFHLICSFYHMEISLLESATLCKLQ